MFTCTCTEAFLTDNFPKAGLRSETCFAVVIFRFLHERYVMYVGISAKKKAESLCLRSTPRYDIFNATIERNIMWVAFFFPAGSARS